MVLTWSTFAVWGVLLVLSGAILSYVIRFIRSMKDPAPAQLSEAKPLRSIGKKSGLHSDILEEGTGTGAKNLDSLTVHYEAFLTTGEKVDSSYDRGKTLTFKLGTGAVILGWDEALKGMKAGEKRRVTVPAKLAYGNKGQNKVPANATLVFEITLLAIS